MKVDEDFYLAPSTFGYLPGLPINHGTDFVAWELVGHVATRSSRSVRFPPDWGLGPDPGYHGLFYVIVRVMGGRGCVLFTATHPGAAESMGW